ncbi:MAG: bacterial Ig-like domain-containing protein [Bacillota bacterium]
MEAGAELKELSYKTEYKGQAKVLDVSKRNFRIEVDENVGDIYFQASGKNAGDTVVINGRLCKDPNHKVFIEPGSNLVNVSVISRHAAVEQYTIIVFRKRNSMTNSFASDIQAKSFNMSEGFALRPAFDQMLRIHSVEVPYENSTLKILVRPESPLAEVGTWTESSGQKIWSAYPKEGEYFVYNTPALQVGLNSATLLVKARNGKINTYELIITRLPSRDASLKADGGLVFKKVETDPDTGEEKQNVVMDIGFDPGTADYTVTVSNEFNEAWFKAAAAKGDEGVKVAYEAEELHVLSDGWYKMPLFEEKNIYIGGEFPIKARENPLKVTVTAPDSVTVKTYTINIIRDLPPDVDKPALVMPLDMKVEGNTLGGANVEFSVRAADVRDGFLKPGPGFPSEPVSVALPSGIDGTFEWDGYELKCQAFLPLGTHTINCEARDKAGNLTQGSFKITVVDTKGPVISGVPDKIGPIEATSLNNTTVAVPADVTVTAYDTVDGQCEVIYSPVQARLGLTFGRFMAKDRSGNVSGQNVVVEVVDTTVPNVDIQDYVYTTDQDEVYISWDGFIKNQVTVTDNTGIRWQGIQKATDSQMVFYRGVTLKAGTVIRFKYVGIDYGGNIAVKEFNLSVRSEVSEAPKPKPQKELSIILGKDAPYENIEFVRAASDIAIDRNLDNIAFTEGAPATTDYGVATAAVEDGKLKITTHAPGRADITVQVTDGTHTVPVIIPVKVYGQEEPKMPQAKNYRPGSLLPGKTIEIDVGQLAEDENNDPICFEGWAYAANNRVTAEIRDGKLVIKAVDRGCDTVTARISDGSRYIDVAVPVTVNSLPQVNPDIDEAYPQLARLAETEIGADIAAGSTLRIKSGKAFKDIDADSLTLANAATDNADVATAAISPEGELVIEGHQEGTADITLDVSDGPETVTVTIHASVGPARLSRIAINTMPTNYPYVGDGRPELDLTGMSIIAAYNDGRSETVEYTDDGSWQITGYQGSGTAGDQTVTLTWGGASVNFVVTVYEQQFVSISISDFYPSWYVGDTAEKLLERDGLKAWGTPPGGSIDDKMQLTLAPGNIKGFDTSRPSDSVPVWVEYGSTVSEAVYAKVLPVSVSAIELAFESVAYPGVVPSTFVGNPLDLTGWDITAVYNNGDRVKLYAKEVDILNFDSSSAGIKTFTLGYQTVYETVYGDFQIDFVSEPFTAVVDENYLTDIELNTLPDKTAYWQGEGIEALKLDGLTFTGDYADGRTAVLSYNDSEIDDIGFLEFDTGLPGDKELKLSVTVRQSPGNLVKEFAIPIKVVKNNLTKMEITQLPSKRQFNEWEGVSHTDFSGLVVRGTYENGTVVDNMPLTASNFTIDRRPGKDRRVVVAVDNKEVSFTIDIEPLKVVSLELLEGPEEINYFVGQPFNKRGMKVGYRFNSGETVDMNELNLDDRNFSGFDSRTPVLGQVVTYQVDDASVSFTVNVQEDKLVGLRLDSLPWRTWFYQYEEPDFSGMKLTGLLTYNREKDMKYVLYEFSGFDSSKPAEDQEVTIKIEDQTVSFAVDILPVENVKSLTLGSGQRTDYLLGDSLNVDNLSAMATFTGQDYNPITGKVETREFGVNIWPTVEDISGFDSSQPATGQVLSFTLGGKTATYTVDILEPELLSLSVIPSKTTYYTGDVLKPEDLTVLGTYANGYVRTIPAGVYTISGFVSSKAFQRQEVTVSYKGKSDTFIIQVLPLEIQSISVKSGLTDYYIGEPLYRSTLQVSADYNNGTRKQIPSDRVQISGFDSSKEAEGQEVTVSYQGKQDSFLVNILGGTRPGPVPGSGTGSGGGSDSGSDSDSGSGGSSSGGNVVTPAPIPVPEVKDSLTVPPSLDKNTGKATASVDAAKLTDSFSRLNADEAGVKKLAIEIPAVEDAKAYEVALPSSFLTEKGVENQMEIRTSIGTVTVPGNMLSNIPAADGKTAGITIAQGDKSGLPEEVKTAIGDRPIIQLTMTLDGTQTEWNNPDAPVTVSIPYTPTAAELANPESIVIWYIDGSGNVASVPNGRYDPATGTVTFTTTHFSYYAVSYNPVSFKDVAAGAWYAKAVSFIAARGITTGTGGGNFSPEAKLTRAQFIVMLMRAYGIAPDLNPKDNFADAGSTWYTGYLAAAKRLQISAGVGNNMFAPEKEITRQEMFTLLYNGLKATGRLPRGSSGRTLSDFSDAGDIAPWAKEAMKLLVETGTISGSGNRLLPKDTTTRAQMAQVLYSLLSK